MSKASCFHLLTPLFLRVKDHIESLFSSSPGMWLITEWCVSCPSLLLVYQSEGGREGQCRSELSYLGLEGLLFQFRHLREILMLSVRC